MNPDRLFQNARIIVADDEENIGMVLQDYLSSLGADCRITTHPAHVIDWIQSSEYDVILSDINMPEISGNDIVALVNEICPNTPVILMTGKPTLDHSINAIRLGAFDFLLKPFHLEEVKLTLIKALQYRRLQMENLEYQTNLEVLVDQRTHELSEFLFHSVQSLSHALEARDPYTQGHGEYVSQTVLEIAAECGVPEPEFQSLRLAALLHDIGKIGVPDSILLKPGPLTTDEYEKMKEHVEIGYRILSPIPSLREVSRYVYEHHERMDGEGYPRGLSGDEIHFNSRILMAAEVLDALATDRCYKKAWPLHEIVDYFTKSAGTIFDCGVVEALLALLNRKGEAFLKNPFSRQQLPTTFYQRD
ncbi:MAG: response regulator [bacterium]|nr:response regulator [bacterium]